MTLWLVFTLMTATVILVVLWPLSGGRVAQASGTDLAVYQDQIAEIARDRAAGLIGEGEAEAARVEISRRLLAAADRASADPAGMSLAWRGRLVAITALFALPIGAGGLYLALGSPGLPDQPLAAKSDAPPEQRSEMIRGMVARLATRLQRDGSDVEGWLRLVRAYSVLGRRNEAQSAAAAARRALAADPDKLRRLDALVKDLGLEG